MQIKKFILTSALVFTTGTAFGAASVRAPKVSGGAVAPATTIAPVRAGTLRAQTLKTPSVATPATITTSVATPIATESTESRMALSKAFKSLNPKQVKDKAAAQQELDVISDQIQELQAKLDTAKTDQTTVLTESNIDDKIIANVESKTYTKDEINTLLAEIEKKLPKIDEKGNINIPTSNGKGQIRLLPYYLYDSHGHGMLGHSMEYRLYTPHDFGTTNWYPDLAIEYTNGWINDICAPYQSSPDFLACGFWTANGTGTELTNFFVSRCEKGYYLHMTTPAPFGKHHKYETYENKTEEQIREDLCGNVSNDLCWISNFEEYEPLGGCTIKFFWLHVSDAVPPYYYVTTTQNDGGLMQTDHYNLTYPGSVSSIPDEWITETCAPHQSNPNLVSCGLGGMQYANNVIQSFKTAVCYKGFYQVSTQQTEHGVKYDYVTFENLTLAQILNHFCENKPSNECWISNYYESIYGDGCIEKTFTVNNEPPYYLDETYTGSCAPIVRVEFYRTIQPQSEETLDEWALEACSTHQSDPNFIGCRRIGGCNEHMCFGLHVLYEGFCQLSMQFTNQGMKYKYYTNENLTEEQIREHFCGNTSTDLCWISDYEREVHNTVGIGFTDYIYFYLNITHASATNQSTE